jgi:hypothetical protein
LAYGEEYQKEYPYAAMRRELRRREEIKKAQGETKFEKVQYLSGTLNPEIKKGLAVTITGSEIRIDPWNLVIPEERIIDVTPFTTASNFWTSLFPKLYPFGGKRIAFIDSEGREQYMCLKFA